MYWHEVEQRQQGDGRNSPRLVTTTWGRRKGGGSSVRDERRWSKGFMFHSGPVHPRSTMVASRNPLVGPGHGKVGAFLVGEAQEVSGHLQLSTVRALRSTDLNVKRHLFEEVLAMSGDEVVRFAVPKGDTPVLTQWLAHTDVDQDCE